MRRMYELIPYIEKEFRGIGKSWARFLYGGSTGGWAALAAQVLYPDDYGTCYAACPDPIDFRAYTVVNLYEDKNDRKRKERMVSLILQVLRRILPEQEVDRYKFLYN